MNYICRCDTTTGTIKGKLELNANTRIYGRDLNYIHAVVIRIDQLWLAWWWRRAGRRHGVEAAGSDAEGRAQPSDPHFARREEEVDIVQDSRGDGNDVIARVRTEAIAETTASRAAVVLDVSHRRRRTHGEQGQRDAGGNNGHLEHRGSHGDQD